MVVGVTVVLGIGINVVCACTGAMVDGLTAKEGLKVVITRSTGRDDGVVVGCGSILVIPPTVGTCVTTTIFEDVIRFVGFVDIGSAVGMKN
jgi:hypothetical protein